MKILIRLCVMSGLGLHCLSRMLDNLLNKQLYWAAVGNVSDCSADPGVAEWFLRY